MGVLGVVTVAVPPVVVVVGGLGVLVSALPVVMVGEVPPRTKVPPVVVVVPVAFVVPPEVPALKDPDCDVADPPETAPNEPPRVPDEPAQEGRKHKLNLTTCFSQHSPCFEISKG